MIVPGGGIALDGERWISSRPAFLLPVRVLGKLFRRLFLTGLIALHDVQACLLRKPRTSRRAAALPVPPLTGPQ
jgi:hypothetical protein